MLFYSFIQRFYFRLSIELHAFQEKLDDFKARGVEVIACSTDTPESHWGWLQVLKKMADKGVTYPLIADQTKTIAKNYGVLLEIMF